MKRKLAALLTGTLFAASVMTAYGVPVLQVSAEPAEEIEEEEANEEAADPDEVYAGTWAEQSAERVVLTLDPADEDGWFEAEITWREDLPQKDVYTMQAQYQEDGSLYYEDCTYVIRTFEEDGSFTDEVQYEDGAGLFWYDPDADTLYWTDYETGPEENVTEFIKADYLAEEAAEELITTGGEPWVDSDLKANILADMELSPRDDFHLFVNYEWLNENDIPEGYSSYNAFQEVKNLTDIKALELLEDETLEGDDARLVQTYYRAILDWDARDEVGIAPAQAVVEDIMSIDSLEALSDFICDPERSYMVPTFAAPGNTAGLEDSSKYITAVATDGFTLGDAAEYKERTEMGDRYYEAYLSLAIAMLTRMGYSEEEATAMYEDMIGLETKLAEKSMTRADQLSPDYFLKINNVLTPEELAELSPVFPLTRFIESFGYGAAEQFLVMQPAAIENLNDLYTEDNLEAMKAYMAVSYVTGAASLLDREADAAATAADNMISGSTGKLPDEINAFNIVRGSLPTPMDRAYLEKYDASELKEQITGICEDIIGVYRDMLTEEDWLSEETREKAIEKLDSITINAVYPDKWIDYSSLDLEGLSYYDCVRAISDFNTAYDVSLTNGEVDREIWGFDILEPNAYYDPSGNSINIILGLMDEPFYYEGISKEALLGTVGVVIGHEISHAFDTNGAQFDKDGNFANWWTDEDYAAFQERAEKLAAYYDGMQAWEGRPFIGSIIQTEAIADMAGMKAVLTLAAREEDFRYEELFEAFASIWRRLNTRESEFRYIMQDPHPMHYLRTNVTLQQFDEFLETYDVQEGDKMYLAPEDRVLVW